MTELVPLMPLEQINTGVEPCPTALLLRLFGPPADLLTDECLPADRAAPFWAGRFVTADVGPFRATGHRRAILHLRNSLADVARSLPVLYAALGSAGMLCLRHVRGRPGVLSNHAFGLAIDVTIDGRLDRRGDRQVMRGLVDLYSVLKRHGWYWGAEFGVEDAMHFEVGSAVVRAWIKAGEF